VEWVQTTGRTVDDAKEAALDQLGIDESEAEFEVLDEAKTGLFGRVRSDARVRARVVPKLPRPKQERRPRKQRSRGDDKPSATTAEVDVGDTDDISTPPSATPSDAVEQPRSGRSTRNRGGSSSAGSSPKRVPTTQALNDQEGNKMSDDAITVDQQADIVGEFLDGLLEALAVEGDISRSKVDEDTIELRVEGNDLGLLIGPKGQTLTAVHELSRTVLQRRATGRHEGRVRIDIGGYRQRRQEALSRFVRTQAQDVIDQGVARALEPMNAIDRKIVHDTVNEIAGIATVSEGVDPTRRVVITPEGAGERSPS